MIATPGTIASASRAKAQKQAEWSSKKQSISPSIVKPMLRYTARLSYARQTATPSIICALGLPISLGCPIFLLRDPPHWAACAVTSSLRGCHWMIVQLLKSREHNTVESRYMLPFSSYPTKLPRARIAHRPAPSAGPKVSKSKATTWLWFTGASYHAQVAALSSFDACASPTTFPRSHSPYALFFLPLAAADGPDCFFLDEAVATRIPAVAPTRRRARGTMFSVAVKKLHPRGWQ